MHWLEDDLPPDRTDLTRPDQHRAVRRRGRHLGRLARCVRQGDQPHNLRHRHHPPNAGVSMSVPHPAPRGKGQDHTTPPVGAINPRSQEEPVRLRCSGSTGSCTPGSGSRPLEGPMARMRSLANDPDDRLSNPAAAPARPMAGDWGGSRTPSAASRRDGAGRQPSSATGAGDEQLSQQAPGSVDTTRGDHRRAAGHTGTHPR